MVGFRRVYRRYGRTVPFFSVLYSPYRWWGGGFVPAVMVVERGDATAAVLGLLQILVSYSQFSYILWGRD
jgi:hypothetical protein